MDCRRSAVRLRLYDEPARQSVTCHHGDQGGDLPRAVSPARGGPHVAAQVVAANLDTVLVGTRSPARPGLCRVEPYLAVAWAAARHRSSSHEGRPVHDAGGHGGAGRRGRPGCRGAAGEPVTARDAAAAGLLGPGNPIGPVGVGKSSLANALAGRTLAETARSGRRRVWHTYLARELHLLPAGGLLNDTPDAGAGPVRRGPRPTPHKRDVTELAEDCRFQDGGHCPARLAIAAAMDDGRLTLPDRPAS